jgi:hypothetical protein
MVPSRFFPKETEKSGETKKKRTGKPCFA